MNKTSPIQYTDQTLPLNISTASRLVSTGGISSGTWASVASNGMVSVASNGMVSVASNSMVSTSSINRQLPGCPDWFPDWEEFELMCTRYPTLKASFEKLEMVYKLCISDAEVIPDG